MIHSFLYISIYKQGSSGPGPQGKLRDQWGDVRLFDGSKIGSHFRCPPAAAEMKKVMKQASNMSQKSSKIGPASILRPKQPTSSWTHYLRHQTNFLSSRHPCFVGSQVIRDTRKTSAYTATSPRPANRGFCVISDAG